MDLKQNCNCNNIGVHGEYRWFLLLDTKYSQEDVHYCPNLWVLEAETTVVRNKVQVFSWQMNGS